MKSSQTLNFSLIGLFLIILMGLILFWGPVDVDFISFVKGTFSSEESTIFWQLRVPRLITALFAGAALATSGLILQTFFQNPLAGPFVLGIHSGASLGVAIWILAYSAIASVVPEVVKPLGLVLSSFIGSFVVVFMLMGLASKLPGKLILLIVGLMFGYLASGVINILVVLSGAHEIKTYLLWTLGSFSRVAGSDLQIFVFVSLIGLVLTLFSVKSLNVLLLGDRYAKTLGVSLKKNKLFLLLVSSLLIGTVTAFCGPIAFLGIIVPHLSRVLFRTNNHRILVPAVILLGAVISLLAEFLSSVSPTFPLPLNSILGLLSAPVIFAFLLGKNRGEVI